MKNTEIIQITMSIYFNKNSVIREIASIENLILAWRRVESSFQHGNVWYDEIDLAKFKFQLLENVRLLSKQILEGGYQLHSIVPAPFPKCCDEEGNLQVRQSFLVNVADQVVWMAVVNIIGRDFEKEMPAWSYGNRLDVPVWKEGSKWKFGDIRTTSKLLYRSWSRSWPLYRKQLTATIKKMAFSRLSDEEKELVSENLEIDDAKSYLKLPYFQDNYFVTGNAHCEDRNLYWVGLDLSKFYQKVNMSNLCEMICGHSKYSGDEAFCSLIKSLTSFQLDVLNYSDSDLEIMQLSRNESFTGLPTGLAVAGFLANIYLLDIDKIIKGKLENNKSIAHFRYVDDHVFLASSPRVLIDWVSEYINLLKNRGLDINPEKCDPKEVRDLILNNIDAEDKWKCAKLDPIYPSPLMTETLQKVSALSDLNIDLLTDAEFEMVFNDLQMLMVTDIPEEEIKKGTRISFMSTMLTRMVAQWNCDMEQLYFLRESWLQGVNSYMRNQKNTTEDDIRTLVNVAFGSGIPEELKNPAINNMKQTCQSVDIKWNLVDEMYDSLQEGWKNEEKKCKKIFSLLKKAIFEVPDKSKIWIRALDFCSLHLPDELLVIFNILNKLRADSQLHLLGYEYLFAMLLIRTSHNMIKALNRLTINNYAIPYQCEHDRLFLQKAIKISIPESAHYMICNASLIYHKACLLYKSHQHELKLNHYDAKDEFCSEVAYNGEKLGANFWLLWGISLLNKYVPREELNMKKLFGLFLKDIQPTESYFMPLICYCMNELREADYKVIPFNDPISLPSDINIFEFLYNLKYLPGGDMIESKIQGYELEKQIIRRPLPESWIRLSDWVNTLHQEKDINSVYQSEYFATKIIYSIAKEVRSKIHSQIACLHPFTIIMNDEDFSDSCEWMLWKNKELTIFLEAEQGVDDSFYTYPSKILSTSQKRQVYFIYGLGMIFLQLISKRVVMPWIIYRPEFGFEWMSVLRSLMMNGGVSTRNYNIIRSCLSERNRENLRMFSLQEDFETNIRYDGKTYCSIDDLIADLEVSIESMESNMVSVAGYHTRQLTVISLKE